MISSPTISVVTTVYNAGPYLATAVESVLCQTWTDFEFILVDDGSTDGSTDLLRRYADADSRIRLLSRPNTGIVGASNDGLAMVKGEFVARMDADDIAFPERFERQLDYLRQHADCVAVGSAILHVDTEGAPIGLSHRSFSSEEMLQGRSGLAHPASMIRADALKEIGGYDPEFPWVHDAALWFRLEEIGRLASLPEVLLAYRLHSQSFCWKRREQLRVDHRRLLQKVHERRGLVYRAPLRIRRRGGRSSRKERSRWVREATKHGFSQTAWKHALWLLTEHPAYVGTWWALTLYASAYVKRKLKEGNSEAKSLETAELVDEYARLCQTLVQRMEHATGARAA